ncbi:hypothetical protein MCOR14_004263 [Pyricularia oryzae]|uniref:AMP-dependent synthetase/ligase domain-containing protein n=1 Tax=Pyricularia oryzae TaxID=318829 RepID=A0A4P7NRB7_PYROR|nr:hypothetical protein MCOR34_011314 [Pyricularia oryzae]KAI6446493.1 hypothetical protein MCOR17_010759 [Pyricularia oryzae]KAI6504970.1 putative NRPS-like protein biosynthetic cluster [Pyricularia oryzae]KAI6587578.1 putative NRPS-like protein biosynthetic cluster [Pyricularia oryzae]KAI6638715.1 hypothetical protein MCOR14_004263 [Pyricularia oryzae]
MASQERVSCIDMAAEMDQTLLPDRLEQLAAQEPDRIWVSYAVSQDVARDGFRNLTLAQYARAVDRLAWHIESTMGRSSTFSTFLYFGLTDVRYAIVLLAAIKTGHKVLFCSHFNSTYFNQSVCDRTGCDVLLHSEGVESTIEPLLQARPMRAIQAPTLESLVEPEGQVERYPYSKEFSVGVDEPMFVTHTSGTTGLPKPVTMTQRSLVIASAWDKVPDLDGKPPVEKVMRKGRRCFMGFPLFQFSGVANGLWEVFYRGKTLVLPCSQPGWAPPATFEQLFEHGDFDCFIGIPYYLELVAKSPRMMEIVRDRLKYIMYGGATLNPGTGDRLAALCPFFSCIGSTESGVAFTHLIDRQDWAWFCFNEEQSGIVWERQEIQGVEDGAGVYELTYVKNPLVARSQPIFWHTSRGDTIKTDDLFVKHPTKNHLWRYYARKDDMVVTKYGWNINPVMVEYEIARHPSVKAVVVGGAGREAIFAIVELVESHGPPEATLDEVWAAVEGETNAKLDKIAQLDKKRLILADGKTKPLPLTPKGNVVRGPALKLYEAEIEEMYERTADPTVGWATSKRKGEEVVSASPPKTSRVNPPVTVAEIIAA